MLLKIGHFIIPFTMYIRKFTKLTQQQIEFVLKLYVGTTIAHLKY